MGIFSGLFKSRDKPTDSTVGSRYTFYMGGSTSGKTVTERSAMQMTAVYSCVRILAEAIAGLPLHVYRYNSDGGKEKAIDHSLYLILHQGMARPAVSLPIMYKPVSRFGIRSIFFCGSTGIGRCDMSFGKMNTFAEITEIRNVKDSEGFSSKRETVLAFIRVYREGRHGSERWANLAAFSEATDLFRFRTIPDLKITTDHFILCNDERFNIISVEDIKGRGMYTEVLAKKVVATSG